MSDSLRERFINALTATIELYDVVLEKQNTRIAQLEHEVSHAIDRIEKLEQKQKEDTSETPLATTD